MKKILLVAALMGSFSFASVASDTPNKKGELSSRAITQETTVRNANKLKPQACGWETYYIGCGGSYDYIGHSYICNTGDRIQYKMSLYDMYCG